MEIRKPAASALPLFQISITSARLFGIWNLEFGVCLDLAAQSSQRARQSCEQFRARRFAITIASHFDRLAECHSPARAEEREPARPTVKFLSAGDDARQHRDARDFRELCDAVLDRAVAQDR